METYGNGYPLARDLTPRLVPIADLKPLGRATRKHSPQQVRKLAGSIEKFGFVLPVVIDPQNRVVAGMGVVEAAKKLELAEVPAVAVADLSEADLRLLRLALNRISEDAAWDPEALRLEFADVLELAPEAPLVVSGFELAAIDVLLHGDGQDEEDEVPAVAEGTVPVTQPGDLWVLGEHRLICGDALSPDSYERLLEGEKAQMMFSDPPYNVRIDGNVSGLGAVKHREFAMATGELSSEAFTAFLKTFMGHAAAHTVGGAIHFICMDWRHLREVLAAGDEVYTELKNLCVWNKTNSGMGSLYRSRHELVFVFKSGTAAHINNVALGRHGRNRTNVWDYVSQSALSGTSKSKISLHPTVKPVAMIADAMRDCSHRGGLVLDPFGGAGTTIVAAERTERKACVIEIDPVYVDVSIARWQRLTGGMAIHGVTGKPYGRTAEPDTTAKGR
jgi:DNA modification methylase